jgi:glycosyltransferase involved in cell wall biosynthesis
MDEADLLVVCDTGSTDDTIDKLKKRNVVVYSIVVDPWRFDVARNISLAFIPADYDICVCTDLDEVLEEGWRTKIESVWTPETTRLKYMYTWDFKDDGSRGYTYWYNKIHKRHGYRWVHPVHENVKYYGDKQEVYAQCADVQLNHFPDCTKSRGSYLPLLELSKKESPKDSNTVFWLGREYMFHRQYDNCIKTLKEHLELESATWDEERWASMRYISKCYEHKSELSKAKNWLYRAIAECPNVREPYVDMARLGYKLKNWALVYLMVEDALQIKERSVSYLSEATSWDETLYDLGAIACYKLGLFDKSFEFATKAVLLNPKNQRLKENMKMINQKAVENKGRQKNE